VVGMVWCQKFIAKIPNSIFRYFDVSVMFKRSLEMIKTNFSSSFTPEESLQRCENIKENRNNFQL